MNTAILLVDSVTYAVKARRTLLAAGIRATIKKINADTRHRGCKYGVFIQNSRLFDAIGVLTQNGISFERWRGGTE